MVSVVSNCNIAAQRCHRYPQTQLTHTKNAANLLVFFLELSYSSHFSFEDKFEGHSTLVYIGPTNSQGPSARIQVGRHYV